MQPVVGTAGVIPVRPKPVAVADPAMFAPTVPYRPTEFLPPVAAVAAVLPVAPYLIPAETVVQVVAASALTVLTVQPVVPASAVALV
jgi:hypothetical protein